MIQPSYSRACRQAVDHLLARGGSLSAYRSSPAFPVGPAEGSWAWKLERLAEEMFHIPYAVACQSGTTALWAAIAAANLQRGGEIITTAFTFSATPASILWAGHRPVFADVLPETACLDPDSVHRMLSPQTRAILPVDLFGGIADYKGLSAFGVPIIEDACQAVGAKRNGTWAGGFGLVGTYSFNGAKNVPAGEAGMLVTALPEIAEGARRLISHGENWDHADIGFNGRLNELTACVAWHGLSEVLYGNTRRRRLAEALRVVVAACGAEMLPIGRDGADTHAHALYVCPFVVKKRPRKEVADALRQRGLQVSEGYIRPPLHEYRAFRRFQRDALPVTERLSRETLLLVTQAPEDTI